MKQRTNNAIFGSHKELRKLEYLLSRMTVDELIKLKEIMEKKHTEQYERCKRCPDAYQAVNGIYCRRLGRYVEYGNVQCPNTVDNFSEQTPDNDVSLQHEPS